MTMYPKKKSVRVGPVVRTVALLTIVLAQARCFGQTALMPITAGKTLAGNLIQLPQDTHGKPLVLVFGFDEAAKHQGAAWGKQLTQWRNEEDGFAFYQVAMLSDAPRIVRGLIVHAIRDAVPQNYRDHMLLLSSNEQLWQKVLEPKDRDLVSVVYCDSSGHILWQGAGASADQFEELHALLLQGAR
jgi:hypothetical protein